MFSAGAVSARFCVDVKFSPHSPVLTAAMTIVGLVTVTLRPALPVAGPSVHVLRPRLVEIRHSTEPGADHLLSLAEGCDGRSGPVS